MSLAERERPTLGAAALAAAGVLLAMAPFLAPRIPVGTDLPKHVMMAHVLSHYHDPALRYDQSFDLLIRARSTALSELSLAALDRMFPPFTALKIFLAGFVLLLWAASRRLLAQAGAPFSAAVVLLPLAHTFCVFNGFLPYVVSMALFPFLLAGLLQPRRTPGRIAGFAAWLVLLYAFHIVAAAVGCLALVIFAVKRQKGVWQIAWGDFAALVPVGAVTIYYILQKGSGRGVMHYFPSVVNHLKSYWGYNVWTLSRASGGLFLLAIVLLFAALAVQLRRGHAAQPLALLACLLVVIGSALPYQIDDWFVVGSRTLPFALIAAVAGLNLRPAGWHIATAVSMALLLVSSVLNTRAVLAVQPKYDEFLSGMPLIPYGSKILPIIENLSTAGNPYVLPFNGIEDVYTIYRGGSNPYVLAMPHWVTPSDPLPDPAVDVEAVGGEPNGAPLLRYKYPPLYAYKFAADGFARANYRGAGRIYDYFILYGRLPSVTPAIEAEGKLIYSRGDLRVYESLHHAGGR